ncbi:MAG: BlaI/MecI/CopY family transcriptional regulator [Bacillota bacterium]|nr:BlaI/MecI/CopY family transcriptional regulator [Bacillota bacterium]MDW7684212.1 BlaI/MecI/CopY family transcriptional regulator [Bacillota bacterium]
MPNPPRITEAEWRVMKVLWDKGSAKSAEVVESLQDTDWNPKTIHTLLSRLVEKKAVKAQKKDNAVHYQYIPLVKEKECQLHESKTLLKKVYNGSLRMMVTSFLDAGALSENELRGLKEILNNSGGGKHDD